MISNRPGKSSTCVVLGLAAFLAGCFGPAISLPVPPPPAPGAVPVTGKFAAGFGRVDITPPPELGLFGSGPEGKKAQGYRLRLYARAMVLDDGRGGRLALVVADLPHISALLHRKVATLTARADSIAIPPDRLILSATHTHSGPGHFYESGQYNASASSVPGYDTVVVDSLTRRIARAIALAVRDLRPARVAWGTRDVWGLTRNRSLEAYRRNQEPARLPVPRAGLTAAQAAIDPRLTMLRVDVRDPATGAFVPRGAFSLFAIHGTGNNSENDLYDPDIHGVAARGLEDFIDRFADSIRYGRAPRNAAKPFLARAVSLLANGAEGDVSPDWPVQSRCPVPRLVPEPAYQAPNQLQRWHWEHPPDAVVSRCTASARQTVEHIGNELARETEVLFQSLQPEPEDPTLDRAFVTLHLADSASRLGICPNPMPGTATIGGAPDARTRFYGWHIAGIIDAGFEEGGAAVDPRAEGCNAEKRLLLGKWLGKSLISKGLPHDAQVAVFRVGPMLLAGVPAEITTTASSRMTDAMIDSARAAGMPYLDARLISLANGFMEYVPTAEEYTAQFYEGGSDLYGPHTAVMFGAILGHLTASLARLDPIVNVGPMMGYPGNPKVVMPSRSPEAPHVPGSIQTVAWRGDTMLVRWTRGVRGDWPPDTIPAILFEHKNPTGWETVAFDNDPHVATRAIAIGVNRVHWETRWVTHCVGTVRVNLPDSGADTVVSCATRGGRTR